MLFSRLESNPIFINHPQPDLQYDYTLLLNTPGIINIINKQEFKYSSDLLSYFKAHIILLPDNHIGKLEPLYPIIKVGNFLPNRKYNTEKYLSEGYLFRYDSMRHPHYRYGVYKNNKWHLIKNINDAKLIFAPINNELEAFSYAILLSGHYPYFGLKHNKSYRYFVNNIEDSYSMKTRNKFIVLLYGNDNKYGCGSFPEYSIKLEITQNGDISEIEKIKVFEDLRNVDCWD